MQIGHMTLVELEAKNSYQKGDLRSISEIFENPFTVVLLIGLSKSIATLRFGGESIGIDILHLHTSIVFGVSDRYTPYEPIHLHLD